jgi:hypothetical protein
MFEIFNMAAYNFSPPLKNAALDFRYIDRIQNNHNLLSAEMSAPDIKWYFSVLTWPHET